MASLQTAGDLRDLEWGEHLVPFGFRLMALGHGDCPALRNAFCGLLGGDGDTAMGGLHAFVRMIGWCGTRRVRLHPPGCCRLSEDERRVLAVVAAAQASLFGGGDAELTTAFDELLGVVPDEARLMAAQGLAASLACHGLHLPARPVEDGFDDLAPMTATLH